MPWQSLAQKACFAYAMGMSDVRVRIAPSPTGNLHVGTARTALFNYLFAKGQQGKFILRVEDTDLERSSPEFEKNIFESLLALGLSWDEGPALTNKHEGPDFLTGQDKGKYGPYQQSQRLPIYQEWAEKLKAAGLAYDCYVTAEELEAYRKEHPDSVFVSPCRDPQVRDVMAREAQSKGSNRKASLRFRVPDERGNITFADHVRESVTFDAALIGDFVILKSDGMPTYNFAVVIDDWLMKITHVIRGEDHISNTPKQILIFEALQQLDPSVTIPEFAHVGMILAPDRSKLSKRHGATAVSEFIRQGYLPEAFCNFLALLGWFPPDGEEIGTIDSFAHQFQLDKIAHNAAIFDRDKLNAINGKWIRTMDLEALLQQARPYLHALDLNQYSHQQLLIILDAVREKVTLLSELPEAMLYFFGHNVILDAKLVGEVLTGAEPEQILTAFKTQFVANADFSNKEALNSGLKEFTQSLAPIKTKTIMWAIRGAISGRTHGADLSTILQVLGKEVVLHRLETALVLTTGTVA